MSLLETRFAICHTFSTFKSTLTSNFARLISYSLDGATGSNVTSISGTNKPHHMALPVVALSRLHCSDRYKLSD